MEIKAGGNCPNCKKSGSMLIYTGRDKPIGSNQYQRILKCSDCDIEVVEDKVRSNH